MALRAVRRAALVGLCLAAAGCGGADGPPAGGEYADAVPPATCVPQQLDEPGYAPPAGASTTALGQTAAPYELQAPAGRPRGVVLVLHGGGWVGVGTKQLAAVRPDAARWLTRGWATANLDYRPCGTSLDDVLAMHDLIRSRLGPDAPILAVGASAGAHLALMLAVLRPDSVRGVVAMAPPTDPVSLSRETIRDPTTGTPTGQPTRDLASVWRGAFGDRWLAVSPVRRAAEIRARVLLARAVTDPLIPAAQLDEQQDAIRDARASAWVRHLELAPGPVDFPHATVAAAEHARFVRAEDALARPWQQEPPAAPEAFPGWWGPPAG